MWLFLPVWSTQVKQNWARSVFTLNRGSVHSVQSAFRKIRSNSCYTDFIISVCCCTCWRWSSSELLQRPLLAAFICSNASWSIRPSPVCSITVLWEPRISKQTENRLISVLWIKKFSIFLWMSCRNMKSDQMELKYKTSSVLKEFNNKSFPGKPWHLLADNNMSATFKTD